MLTVVMTVAKIAACTLTGSMALLADGFHMATHAGALGIAAAAYAYARRHASSPRFSFGTGKVGDLGGFASALILALVSLGIGIESIMRLLQPTDEQVAAQIRELVEQPGDSTLTDLHVWQVGPGVHAAIVSVVGHSTANADSIRERLKPVHEVSHLTVEFRTFNVA